MNIFEELGIHRYINAQDTFTKYGASCMRPCSLRAMQEISRSCVDLDEVQRKTGDAIARLTHNEAAYLTNGAAGGLMACAAAVLALDSEETYHALPETGTRCEIVIQRAQRNQYDRSLAATGAKIVYVGEADKAPSRRELEESITERTAAVTYFIYFGRAASLPLEDVIEIAHRRGVPVIVDAAAQNPPAENLWRFTALGADMAIFSGGKTLRGPQDSGLVLGKREWIERCRRWGPPMDGVCRGCKTSREAMVGLYAAVKAYLAQDEAAVQCALERACARFERTMRVCGFTRVWREQEGPVGQTFPRTFGVPPFGSAVRLAQLMKERGVYIGAQEDNSILLNPLMLTPQQVGAVCEALKQCILKMEKEEKKNGSN